MTPDLAISNSNESTMRWTPAPVIRTLSIAPADPRVEWIEDMMWSLANCGLPKAMRIIHRERQHMAELRRFSPREWLLRIRTVPRPERADVARIVWWDYFARMRDDNPNAHLLDHYFDEPPSNKMDVVNGLVKCGYSPWQAVMRL